MAKILVVEDDSKVLSQIKDILRFDHHTVDSCDHGEKAQDYLERFTYDLILLDWELPGVTGVELLKDFRSNGGETPIVMLTGRSATSDKITGLNSGADNYLTKPFVAEELLAIVRATVRRSPNLLPDLEFCDIRLSPQSAEALAANNKLNLTRNELELLKLLLMDQKKFLVPELILSKIWGSTSGGTPDAVRHCVTNLRQKLQEAGSAVTIVNLRGVGYKLK